MKHVAEPMTWEVYSVVLRWAVSSYNQYIEKLVERRQRDKSGPGDGFLL